MEVWLHIHDMYYGTVMLILQCGIEKQSEKIEP